MNLTWGQRYFDLAKHVATWSKDPNKQVGAIVTENNYICGIGFNGFPRGIADTEERLADKKIKLKLMVHAEANALRASKGRGDTMYIYPCLPCTTCAGLIIQAGITRVVTGPLKSRTAWDPKFVETILREARVQVCIMGESI